MAGEVKVDIKSDPQRVKAVAQQTGKAYASGYLGGISQVTTGSAGGAEQIKRDGLVENLLYGKRGKPDLQGNKRMAQKKGQAVGEGLDKGTKEKFNLEDEVTNQVKRATRKAEQEDKKKVGLMGRILFGPGGKEGLARTAEEMTRIIMHPLLRAVGMENLPTNLRNLGVMGGLTLTAAQTAMGFAEKAVGFGMGKEAAIGGLAPYMLKGIGKEGFSTGGTRADLSSMISEGIGLRFRPEEVGAIGAPLGRMGGGAALPTALRATRMGAGGEMTEFIGEQVRRGFDISKNPTARQSWTKMFATGTYLGLVEKGRLGEFIQSTTRLMGTMRLGLRADTEQIMAGARVVGRAGFRGAMGAEAMRGLEGLVQGPQTGIGRAVALQAVGLGGNLGGNIFRARRLMERGAFAEGGGGVELLRKITEGFKQTYGISGKLAEVTKGSPMELMKDAMIAGVADASGLTQDAVEQLITSVEKGDVTQEELEKIATEGASTEDKMLKAILDLRGPFDSLRAQFDASLDKLYRELRPLIKEVTVALGEVLRAINLVVDNTAFFGRKSSAERREDKRASSNVNTLIDSMGKFDPTQIKTSAEKYASFLAQQSQTVMVGAVRMAGGADDALSGGKTGFTQEGARKFALSKLMAAQGAITEAPKLEEFEKLSLPPEVMQALRTYQDKEGRVASPAEMEEVIGRSLANAKIIINDNSQTVVEAGMRRRVKKDVRQSKNPKTAQAGGTAPIPSEG